MRREGESNQGINDKSQDSAESINSHALWQEIGAGKSNLGTAADYLKSGAAEHLPRLDLVDSKPGSNINNEHEASVKQYDGKNFRELKVNKDTDSFTSSSYNDQAKSFDSQTTEKDGTVYRRHEDPNVESRETIKGRDYVKNTVDKTTGIHTVEDYDDKTKQFRTATVDKNNNVSRHIEDPQNSIYSSGTKDQYSEFKFDKTTGNTTHTITNNADKTTKTATIGTDGQLVSRSKEDPKSSTNREYYGNDYLESIKDKTSGIITKRLVRNGRVNESW